MKKVSRREIAKTVTKQLIEGKDPKRVALEVAAYLVEHKAVNQLHMVVGDIAAELMRQTGHVPAEVVSAFSLDAEGRTKLESFIMQATNATSVELTITEDKSLLGGVVIKTPGHEYDASVRRKLNQFARGEV